MHAWFLIVTLIDPTSSKMSPFKTEQECHKAMKIAIQELKHAKDVTKIECLEGTVLKEESAKPQEEYL